MAFELRPPQKECLRLIEENPTGKHIIAAHVGFGKTVIMSNIKRLGRVLILSHREELVYQPLKYFKNCTTGVEKANKHSNHKEDVVSASVQSLARRLNEYNPYEFAEIYYDECHHAAAKENRKILEYFKPQRLIGFSATPSRSDDIRLDDIFDDILFEYDIKQGIKNGYLSPIKVKTLKMNYDISNVKMANGDLAPNALAEAMKDTAPMVAEAYYKHARGSTIIFCASVELAYKTAKLIKGAEVIEGNTPREKRQEILDKFANGEIKVVCNNLVLTEGYDNPRIETVILARPTTNVAMVVQCVGRGARLFEGKESCLVLDCVSATRFGLATPASLLGYNMPPAATKRLKTEEELDLLDIPKVAEQLADVPETWIRSIKEIDIWAKKAKVNTHNINLRKRGDGSMVIGLPNNVYYEIPPVDLLGNVTFDNGKTVKAQEAIDMLFKHLMTYHKGEMAIWSKKGSKRWGNKPMTQAQERVVTHLRGIDLSGVEVKKLSAMEASVIIGETKLRKRGK